MNKNLEYMIKHPIKTITMTGAGILFLTNIIKAQERLEGTITDPQLQQGLSNKKITLNLYDPNNGTFLGTAGPVWTDINGHYLFDNITDVEDEQKPNNKAIIQYHGNKIFINNFNEKTLKIYNEIGQEVKSIKTNNPEIDINLEGLATGKYLTVVEMDKKLYPNMIINNAGKIIGHKKLEDHITEENKKLKKITEIGTTITINDSTGQYHSYIDGPMGNWSGQRTFNFTLPPIIQLQIPFIDPEVPYPIDNLMDLWKYMARIQGPEHYVLYAKTLWPMGIFTDTTNTPQTWKQYINNATNIIRDSLGIPADSILTIKNEYTEPNYNLGYSAINVFYLDSTAFKNIVGENLFAGGGFYFDATNEAFIGYDIYLNTDKITNPIDAQKYILRHIQKYATQTTHNINNTNYLGQTGNTTGPGPKTTYNEDERTQIMMIRNFTPNVWINRFFNPGTLYKPGTPKGYERKGTLLVPKEQIITPDNTMYKQMTKQLEEKDLIFK